MKYLTSPADETRFYSNTLLDLSLSQIKETSAPRRGEVCLLDMAEHKRLSVLFYALRYGIKERCQSLISSEKAYKQLYFSRLSKGYVAMKSILCRKRQANQGARRLRKIHLQNLVVKSFSSLLWNVSQAAKLREMQSTADL